MDKIEIQPYEPEEYSNRYNTDGEGVDPSVEVRVWTTAGIRRLLVALEPYLDGTLGDVSPRHASLYLKGLQELNRLWAAQYTPVRSADALAGIESVSARREKILGMLDQLRERGRGGV
jgi:hypothetical protein